MEAFADPGAITSSAKAAAAAMLDFFCIKEKLWIQGLRVNKIRGSIMRIWPFSDTHKEHGGRIDFEPPEGTDVAVIAGDLTNPLFQGVQWLRANLWERHRIRSVYIPGNHEWYCGRDFLLPSVEAAKALAFTKRNEGVHLLMRSSVEIGDVLFLGCTLWTDYRLDGDQETSMAYAARGMNDHRRIIGPDGTRPFSPADALAEHEKDRAWLEQELEKADKRGQKTVVVTHHLPHPRSIHPDYMGSPLNPCFASDLSELVERGGAELWVHGHTHSSCDYVAGGTRVICNPRGYPHDVWTQVFENPQFDPTIVVDI